MSHILSVLFTALILGVFSAQSLADASQIKIEGSVQFWSRFCHEDLTCELPVAISEKITISGQVNRPAQSTALGSFHDEIDTSQLKLFFDTYWKISSETNPMSYLAHQIKLVFQNSENAYELITECTQYMTDQTLISFPVGMCSGYIRIDNEMKQFGVTLYK